MPLLNFKKQFAGAVRSGEKRQTIRALRNRLFLPGDTLYLYTGLRTKGVEKLGEVVCKTAQYIEMDSPGIGMLTVKVEGKPVADHEKEAFALADGFTGPDPWLEFKRFFLGNHQMPFEGQLIKW